ncbi:hypothetical protein BH10PAT3_BH10PAT3_2130 [soil metagenome]
MFNLLSRYAETGPVIHIAPSEVLKSGNFVITNSMIYGWATAAVIIIGLITVSKLIRVKPRGGLIQFIEAGVEMIMGVIANALGSREKAVKYTPYFATIFFFVLLNNWFGLLPGVGEALTIRSIPLLRPYTADLNGTLAIAVVTMILVQTFAIKESGLLKHIRHYFAGNLKNPVTYLFGGLEVFTEFTRVISLALRLFLNVVIGEVIISVFGFLGKAAAPLTALPFTLLEMFVAALQAYIFVMLSVTYLAVAIHHDDEDSEAIEAVRPTEDVPKVSRTKKVSSPGARA